MDISKRPLGDYSQDTPSYKEGSVSYQGINDEKPIEVPFKPSSLFSNQPIHKYKMGTFVVENKEKKTTTPIEHFLRTGPKIGREINSTEATRKTLKLGKLAEKAGIEISETPEGTVVSLPPDFVENLTEVENEKEKVRRLEQRVPLIIRFSHAQKQAEDLYSKKIDQSIKTEVLSLVSSLEWLHSEPSKEIPDEKSLEKSIQKLETILKEQEQAHQNTLQQEQADALKKAQESLLVIQRLIPLSAKLATLIQKTENLPNGTEKDTLLSDLQILEEAEEILRTTTNQNLIDPFTHEIEAYALKLSKITGSSLQQKEKDIEVEAVVEKKPIDVWSGWPDAIRYIPPKGLWQITTRDNTIEPLTDGATWSKLNINFKKEWNDYESFMKSGDSIKKIEQYRPLIELKNKIIASLLDLDVEGSAKQIELFRIKINEAKQLESKDTFDAKKEKGRLLLMEQKRDALNLLNIKLTKLEGDRDFLVPQLTSDEEKAMLVREFTKLTNQKASIENSIEDGETALGDAFDSYNTSLDKVDTILTAIRDRLTKMYGGKILRSASPLINGNQKIKLRNGETSTVKEWSDETMKSEASILQIKQTIVKESYEKLLEKHKHMLDRNPLEYKNIYLNKEWVTNDPNKKASEEALSLYAEKINKQRSVLEDQIKHETDATVKIRLLGRLTELNKEAYSLSGVVDGSKKTKLAKFEAGSRMLAKLRETYSPSHDKELSVPRPVADDLSKEQIQNLGKDEVILTDTTISPHHTSGMTHSLTVEEGESDPNAYFVEEQATYNEEDPTPDTSLEKKKRLEKVGKLFETISNNIIKKYGKDWRVYAVAVASLATAVIGIESVKAVRREEPQRLEQLMSWRDYFDTPEDKEFLKDFIGKDELSFTGLIKKYAPSININEHNPATLAAISSMECTKLLNSPESVVYGLNNEQRSELCSILRKQEKIIQATDTNKRTSSSFSQHPYSYNDQTITLQKFYDIVRQAATQADKEQSKK